MARPANPPETRVLRALRQVNAITGAQFDDALARLEATEPCDRCGGDGDDGGDFAGYCAKCEGTGAMRTIR